MTIVRAAGIWPAPADAAVLFDSTVQVIRSGWLDALRTSPKRPAPSPEVEAAALMARLVKPLASGTVLTDLGSQLTSVEGYDGSAFFRFVDEVFRPCYGHAKSRITEGGNNFIRAFGRAYFDYLSANAGHKQLAHIAMVATQAPLEHCLAAQLALADVHSIVDVGGGVGGLGRALVRRWPSCRVTVADVDPSAGALVSGMSTTGVTHEYADFFDSVPTGADLYCAKLILHDWEDDDARRVLAVIAKAMARSSRLAVIESPLPALGRPDISTLWDVHQLLTMGGRERRVGEIQALAADVGLHLQRVEPGPEPLGVLWFGKQPAPVPNVHDFHRACARGHDLAHLALGLAMSEIHGLWLIMAPAQRGNAATPEEIALHTGTRPEAMARLLRAWSYLGLASEHPDGCYAVLEPARIALNG